MGENKAKRKGVNILDLLVLVIFVAAILFATINLIGNKDYKQKDAQDNISFTVEFTNSDPAVLNYIEEGDIVYNGVTKEELGTVKSIHERPARTLVENHEAQTIEYAEVPGKIDVTLEMEGKAKMAYPDITVGTVSLKVGKKLDCIVGNAAMHGYIVGVDYENSLLVKGEETADDN